VGIIYVMVVGSCMWRLVGGCMKCKRCGEFGGTHSNDCPTRFCKWAYDEDLDMWQADCGDENGWTFNEAGPVENRMRHCPFCGKLLVVAEKPIKPMGRI
jgi:hypothetical protein